MTKSARGRISDASGPAPSKAVRPLLVIVILKVHSPPATQVGGPLFAMMRSPPVSAHSVRLVLVSVAQLRRRQPAVALTR